MLWENTYWGMASVQNFGVIFFVIGLFYFLSKDGTKDFNRAILFAILATFTSGNGFLALPIALFLLILQKENKRAIQFSIVSILLAFVYFYHYKSPENPPFHGTIKEYSKAFLAFLGNLADFKPNAILTLRMKYLMLTGTGIFVLSILYGIKLLIQSPIFTKKIDKQNHFYFGILLFLLASALIVVVGRMGFGVQTMLTSRYKIYSILLVIVLYCLLIQWTNYKKWISQIAFGLALIFNIWMNFQYFEEVIYQRNRLISFDFNASYTNFSGNRQFDAKVPYTAPKQFYDGKFVQIVNQLKDTTQINKTLEIKESNENITIKSDSTSGSSFISLISDKQLFLFPTRQNCAATRSFFLKDGIYFANGFTANIDKNDLPSGTYLLGLVQEDEDNLTATNLNKTILVEKNQTKKKVNW